MFFELFSKFNCALKTLLHEGLSDTKSYMVDKFKKLRNLEEEMILEKSSYVANV